MNWMGGARTRIKASSDKKKQREFFEKRKRIAAQKDSSSNLTNTALSGDLISFYLTQKNLMKNIHAPKPTKIIKQDLDKHSLNGSKYVNLPQLPPNFNSGGTPIKNWKIPKRLNESHIDQENSEDNDSICADDPRPFQVESSPSKPFSSFADMNEIDFPKEERKPKDLEMREEVHPLSMYDRCTFKSRSLTPSCSFQYPNQTPDINEAFKRYVYVDRFQRLKEHKENYENASIDLDEDLHKAVLEKQFQRDLLVSRRGMEQLTCKKRSKAKSKLYEKMNALLSNYEIKERSNSTNSLSQWSKHNSASMPRKVTRDDNYSLEDMECGHPESDSNSGRACRESLNELEKMIEATALKQQKERISNKFCRSPESMNSEHANFSSTDSSSPASPNLNIPNFFKRKKNSENSRNCIEHDRNITASYKKFCATVTDRKAYDTDEAMINCQRTIKISRREFLDSEDNDVTDITNGNKYKFGIDMKPSDIERQLLPSSLLTYFPTPKVLKSEKCSVKIIQIPKTPTEDYSQEEYNPTPRKNGYMKDASNENKLSLYSSRVETNGHTVSENSDKTKFSQDSLKETNSFRNENGTVKRKVNVATSPFPCFKFYTKAKNVQLSARSPMQFVDEDPLKLDPDEKSVNVENSIIHPFIEKGFGKEFSSVRNEPEKEIVCKEDNYYDLPPTVPNSPASETSKINFTVPETPIINHNHRNSFSNGFPNMIVNETPISTQQNYQDTGSSLQHSFMKNSEEASETKQLPKSKPHGKETNVGSPSKKISPSSPSFSDEKTSNVNGILTPRKERFYHPKLNEDEFFDMNEKSQEELNKTSTSETSSHFLIPKENSIGVLEDTDNTIVLKTRRGILTDLEVTSILPVESTSTSIISLENKKLKDSECSTDEVKHASPGDSFNPTSCASAVQVTILDDRKGCSNIMTFENQPSVETSHQSTQTAMGNNIEVVKFDKGVQTSEEETNVYCQTLTLDLKDSCVQTSP